MSEGVPLTEKSVRYINDRTNLAQRMLENDISKIGLGTTCSRYSKKQPKAHISNIREISNKYQPPHDTKQNTMHKDAQALARGLILGSALGVYIARNFNAIEFYGRAMSAMELILSVKDQAYDIVDVMSLSAKDILKSLNPTLRNYGEPPQDPIEERRRNIYATGLGYTAEIGRCIIIENELRNAQTQDSAAEREITAGIVALGRHGLLSTHDLEW